MKQTFLLALFAIIFYCAPVLAMCTYQNFPLNSNVFTEIEDQTRLTGNYDTHKQSSYHEQCWNSHQMENVTVTTFSSKADIYFQIVLNNLKVTPHGWLKVDVRNIKGPLDGENWLYHWEVNITNFDDSGTKTNDINYNCKNFAQYVGHGASEISTACAQG